MRWNTLFFGCVALLLTGRASSECRLQPQVTILNRGQEMQCDDELEDPQFSQFLRTLDFRVESRKVILEESSLCFIYACCNLALNERHINSIRGLNITVDYEGKTKVGDSLNGNFICKADGHRIASTTARCDKFETDGSGWDLVEEYYNETLCSACQTGTYLADSVTCELCPRGRYTEGEGATQCLYCPAGHTTYSYNPNICVGPQLNKYSDGSGKNIAFTARVSYDTLGNLERKSDYWGSIGNWNLLKSDHTSYASITQKYTTSYRREPRVIRKSPVTTAVEPIIENVYCYKGNGEQYSGYATKTASGGKCKGPQDHCTTANRERICYCKNKRANHGHTKPYCETANGAEEDCDIPKCNKQDSNENEVTPCDYEKLYDNISADPFGSNRIEFGNLKSAQRICDKLGGECTGVWGEGSSWRVTGLSLSEDQLGSGPYEFYGKSSGCGNPYYEYYFEQKWES